MAASFDVGSLNSALESNRKLQKTIGNELVRLEEQKRLNRLKAASCTRRLVEIVTKHADSTHNSTERKWNSPFWNYRKNQTPEANSDTPRRRTDKFFRHLCPPWSEPEMKDLMHAVASVKQTNGKDFATNKIQFFAKVSEILHDQMGLPRSAEECLIQFEREHFVPFSDAEIATLRALVADSNGDVDWGAIAEQISAKRLSPCTAFDCLRAYQKSAKSSPVSAWTLAEDELVFKFLAAAGPQMVLESKNPLVQYTLLEQLLPSKTKTQISLRANHSLLNPNFRHGDWTDSEERRLVIFMKIYNDLNAAAAHLQRSNKSVVDKWQRSLDPEYSSLPFTKAEDAKLVQILRDNSELGWKKLSNVHFPHRHPQRLSGRWSELASDQDILTRESSRKRLKAADHSESTV